MATNAIVSKYLPPNAPEGATGSSGTGVSPSGISYYTLSAAETPDCFYVDEDLIVNIDLDTHYTAPPTQIPWGDVDFSSGPNFPYVDENDANFISDFPDWPSDIATHPEWWYAGVPADYPTGPCGGDGLVVDINLFSGDPGREMLLCIYASDPDVYISHLVGMRIIVDGTINEAIDPNTLLGGVAFQGGNNRCIIKLLLFNSYIIVNNIIFQSNFGLPLE